MKTQTVSEKNKKETKQTKQTMKQYERERMKRLKRQITFTNLYIFEHFLKGVVFEL